MVSHIVYMKVLDSCDENDAISLKKILKDNNDIKCYM